MGPRIVFLENVRLLQMSFFVDFKNWGPREFWDCDELSGSICIMNNGRGIKKLGEISNEVMEETYQKLTHTHTHRSMKREGFTWGSRLRMVLVSVFLE